MSDRRPVRRVTVSAIVSDVLGYSLEAFAPERVLRENSEIHALLGADEAGDYSMEVQSGLILTCRPDAVRGDEIIEIKTLRPYSDREKLMLYAFCQLQLEMYVMPWVRRGIIAFAKREPDGRISGIEETAIERNEKVAEMILNAWFAIQERRKALADRLREVMGVPSREVQGRLV